MKLKQVNKKHSKKISKPFKPVKKISKALKEVTKNERLQNKKERRIRNVNENEKCHFNRLGNNDCAPILCGLFPLYESFENNVPLIETLISSTGDAQVIREGFNKELSKLNCETFLIKSPKLLKKNIAFVSCNNFRDRFDYLDVAKIVDWALYIVPTDLDELQGEYHEELMRSLVSQHFPAACFIIPGDVNDLKQYKKNLSNILRINLDDNVYIVKDKKDANKLMRHLSVSCKPFYSANKKSIVEFRRIDNKHSHILSQGIKIENNGVKLRGVLRGYGWDLNLCNKCHITDVGDCFIESISWYKPSDSNRIVFGGSPEGIVANNYQMKQDELSEDILNWNNVNLEEEDECSSDGDVNMNADEENGEEDDEYEEEVEDILSGDDSSEYSEDEVQRNFDGMSFATTAKTGYSIAQLEKFKKSIDEKLYPDEIELKPSDNARHKLKKYRALKDSFESANWNTNEYLPNEYAHIAKFDNYEHCRNRLFKTIVKSNNSNRSESFVEIGSLVEINLKAFDDAKLKRLNKLVEENKRVILSNLFYGEEKITVVHANMMRINGLTDKNIVELAKIADRQNSGDAKHIHLGEEAMSYLDDATTTKYPIEPSAEPIRSGETMLYQIGFRRFIVNPIYSNLPRGGHLIRLGSAGKSLYQEYMPLKGQSLASMYAPVTYGPTSVQQWRIRQPDLGYEELGAPYVAELVATGSLVNLDPTRPIVKRVFLTGEICASKNKSAVVRFMFFNPEDVQYFHSVKLQTKSKAVGHIVEPVGEHGRMKVRFSQVVDQSDLALMPLYKRVFPEANFGKFYEIYPKESTYELENQNNDDDEMNCDQHPDVIEGNKKSDAIMKMLGWN